MGTTASHALRYPDAGAVNNIPQDIKNLAEDVDGLIPGAWSAFTPAPASGHFGIGAHAYGRYAQIGKTVIVSMTIQFGTSPTSTGAIALPVAPRDGASDVLAAVGGGYASSGSAFAAGVAVVSQSPGGGAVVQVADANTGAAWNFTSSAPFTWTTGRTLLVSFTYEAA